MPNHSKITIPASLIWAQCITFCLLYSVWILRELMFVRRAALIAGALMAVYPIYRYRSYLLSKRALSLWLIVALFVWMIFHLFFFAHDFPAESLEFKRIWKYAALSAIFALGLGLSLTSADEKKATYWPIVYFGLYLPALIYLLRYFLTMHADLFGYATPASLKITSDVSSIYYVPKTDYIAFCLPVLALSLGQIFSKLSSSDDLKIRQYFAIAIYLFAIGATLFLFYVQNTKNGFAYSILCIAIFLVLILLKSSFGKLWQKLLLMMVALIVVVPLLYPHFQHNDSWRTLIADTKVGFQLEQYPQWKYAGERGYPVNEYGTMTSMTNYYRAAWFKAGLQLLGENPLGYGLIEDSFARLTRAKYPDASTNLSHSHSGWLDLALGVGLPGFFCVLFSLILNIHWSKRLASPWREMAFWGLIANLMLWVTTEVSATITFCALIFWIAWASGLIIASPNWTKKNECPEA